MRKDNSYTMQLRKDLALTARRCRVTTKAYRLLMQGHAMHLSLQQEKELVEYIKGLIDKALLTTREMI
jgi:hypothetical protein